MWLCTACWRASTSSNATEAWSRCEHSSSWGCDKEASSLCEGMNNEELYTMLNQELEEFIAELEELLKCAIQVHKFYFK